MNSFEWLNTAFRHGATPKGLHGFYPGRLELLLPANVVEHTGDVISHFWMPWYGKEFHSNQHDGVNALSPHLAKLLTYLYGTHTIVKRDPHRIYAFPFKTKITEGMQDPMHVLKLDYDVLENPPQVRQVVDELVCVEKDKYLGKGYIREGDQYRLVAFFSLFAPTIV
jgi:hypothetical protein